MSITDTKTDIVKMFMNALETNDLEQAASYLSAEFLFDGWTPQALNKQDFLQVMGGLKEGLPGLIFNLHNIQEFETTVTGTIQAKGYQTDSFELPALSLPPIPQMASSVSLPTEDVVFTFNEQRAITRWDVQRVPGGGIHGLIRQLGIDVPLLQ